MVLTQHTVRIEQDAWKETVSIFPGNDLTAVQVTRKDQVVAGGTEAFPASRVVGTNDTDVARRVCRGVRTRDCDGALAVCEVGGAMMDPLPARSFHYPPDAVYPNPPIVVPADRQNRGAGTERGHQVAQMGQLRGRVDKVAAEEYCVRTAGRCGV